MNILNSLNFICVTKTEHVVFQYILENGALLSNLLLLDGFISSNIPNNVNVDIKFLLKGRFALMGNEFFTEKTEIKN